jgi:pyruvate dehydrogenase E1 component alpha subunit
VIAVHDRVAHALQRARAGDGATLIEALTYRLSDHTTADDARRYRDDAEVSARWHEEPILRLRQHLVQRGAWSREDEEKILTAAAAEMEQAAEAYLATPPQPVTAMFDFLFASLPPALAAQRAACLAEAAGHD